MKQKFKTVECTACGKPRRVPIAGITRKMSAGEQIIRKWIETGHEGKNIGAIYVHPVHDVLKRMIDRALAKARKEQSR